MDAVQDIFEAVVRSYFVVLLLCGLAFAITGWLAGRRRP